MITALVALIIGVAVGWLAHRRVSLHYKMRWLEAMRILTDRQLVEQPEPASVTPTGTTYAAGEWTLHETHRDGTAIYEAVRRGFDPVRLGHTPNFERFSALYRRDRENVATAVDDLNSRT